MGEQRSRCTFRRTIAVALIAGLCWLVVRDVLQSQRKVEALALVREMGGRMGGLPAWPFGEEIRVEFQNRDFNRQDLERLTVLKPLTGRNWVGVMFKDSNLTREDILDLREKLPHCVVFRV